MEVIAHRGLHNHAPENSRAAVSAAVDAGLTLVEIDVRATSDGRCVALHDPVVDRTTSGTGALSALDAAEVARLRLADESAPPRVEELLDLCAGRAVLCLDVKESRCARALASLLREGDEGVRVWSADLPVVTAFAARGFATALLASGLLRRGLGPFLWSAKRAGARAVSFYPADLEPHVVAACRNAGLGAYSGTPNDARTWAYLAGAGISGVITDRPLELREFLARFGGRKEQGSALRRRGHHRDR